MQLLRVTSLILLLSQGAGSSLPTLIGTSSAQLSKQDFADLEKLAVGKPWLIDASPQLLGESVVFYLPPERTTRELRRGRMITFQRMGPFLVAHGAPAEWQLAPKGEFDPENYAQVAVEGRAFDEVQGVDDTNGPFPIIGAFDDAELLSLVRFVRSRPMSPDSDFVGRTGAVAGNLPISRILRQKGTVTVDLRKSDSESQEVILRQDGDKWVVVSARFWQA